ncbi:DNA-binding protein [Dokdonia pacifica]|uniref:DNA binding domain-containing protein, excisionase family n=1 Tax=Dokdonia pacifica TaxID=1627892 RepID=A0A239BH09_9FLAO|nr:helix-turn-helix domain-containing protein [Dokdonia pacifica]GGG29356.1 DNA-binding protein [Dokdonia pacifica]SNS07447.1 DNA binding domain-containing protein, excisionase family [Dokdonia pacifica]
MTNNLVLSTRNIDDLILDIANAVVSQIKSGKTKEDLSSKRYSIKEAAKTLDVTALTIRNYIKNGVLKADKIGGKYYIPHAELYNPSNEVKSLKYQRAS